MARLFATQQVASTTNFEVFQGHLHARTQLVIHGDGCQSIVRGFGKRLVWSIEEIGIGALSTAANATANLVQLT